MFWSGLDFDFVFDLVYCFYKYVFFMYFYRESGMRKNMDIKKKKVLLLKEKIFFNLYFIYGGWVIWFICEGRFVYLILMSLIILVGK